MIKKKSKNRFENAEHGEGKIKVRYTEKQRKFIKSEHASCTKGRLSDKFKSKSLACQDQPIAS